MIVFINKLDREGKDAFDLMDEVEKKLGFHVTPLSIPIGMGYDFKGIYKLYWNGVKADLIQSQILGEYVTDFAWGSGVAGASRSGRRVG